MELFAFTAPPSPSEGSTAKASSFFMNGFRVEMLAKVILLLNNFFFFFLVYRVLPVQTTGISFPPQNKLFFFKGKSSSCFRITWVPTATFLQFRRLGVGPPPQKKKNTEWKIILVSGDQSVKEMIIILLSGD